MMEGSCNNCSIESCIPEHSEIGNGCHTSAVEELPAIGSPDHLQVLTIQTGFSSNRTDIQNDTSLKLPAICPTEHSFRVATGGDDTSVSYVKAEKTTAE